MIIYVFNVNEKKYLMFLTFIKQFVERQQIANISKCLQRKKIFFKGMFQNKSQCHNESKGCKLKVRKFQVFSFSQKKIM